MITISKETLQFLKDLKENNNRDWMQDNKKRYQAAKENAQEFVTALINRIADFEPSVMMLEAKDVMFRLHRDVRFSKDKTPYKTHFSAAISKGGKKSDSAGFYFQISPDKFWMAGGVYHPEKERLFHLREELAENGGEFLSIMNDKDFSSTFTFWGDQLKRIPKGFDKEDPMEHWIRHKDFLVQHEAPAKMIGHKDMLDYCDEVYRKMKPFNDYVNKPLALKE
jgi:uncharacterized protein (TIGR02453 family)